MSGETIGYGEGGYGFGGYGGGLETDSFPLTFDHVYPLEVHFATEVFEKEDGTEKRLSLMHTPLHIFEGLLLGQTEAERLCLEDFFIGQMGTESTFSFTDPLATFPGKRCPPPLPPWIVS